MYALLVLAVLAQPAPQPAETAVSGSPPEQVLASIDAKGKMTIVYVACNCYGPAVQENSVDLPAKKDEKPTKVKVKVSSVTITTAELSAKHVEAYTVDGNRLEPEKLAKLLAKEKMVLISMDGKKIDPALLQLFKDDTIVLVPPANTLNMGGAGVAPYPVPSVEPVPIPAPVPDNPKKPEKDEKKE